MKKTITFLLGTLFAAAAAFALAVGLAFALAL